MKRSASEPGLTFYSLAENVPLSRKTLAVQPHCNIINNLPEGIEAKQESVAL